MNSKLLFAATVAVALLSSGVAMATEATQIEVPSGTLTRAEVKAELTRAIAAGELKHASVSHGDFDRFSAGVRARAEVRDEARTEARTRRVAAQYFGA